MTDRRLILHTTVMQETRMRKPSAGLRVGGSISKYHQFPEITSKKYTTVSVTREFKLGIQLIFNFEFSSLDSGN